MITEQVGISYRASIVLLRQSDHRTVLDRGRMPNGGLEGYNFVGILGKFFEGGADRFWGEAGFEGQVGGSGLFGGNLAGVIVAECGEYGNEDAG